MIGNDVYSRKMHLHTREAEKQVDLILVSFLQVVLPEITDSRFIIICTTCYYNRFTIYDKRFMDRFDVCYILQLQGLVKSRLLIVTFSCAFDLKCCVLRVLLRFKMYYPADPCLE